MRIVLTCTLILVSVLVWGQTKSTHYQSYQNGQFLHGQTVTGTNTNNLAINTWTDSVRVGSTHYQSKGTQGTGLEFVFNPSPPLSTPPIVSSAGSFIVYPNPFSNEINIDFENIVGAVEVSIVNILGQKENIQKQSFGSSLNLNTSQLRAGTYMLQIKTVNGVAIFKVVKAQ